MPAGNDRELVRLAVAGDLLAFDELSRRYQSTLVRFLRQRLPGNEVEDAAQDILIKAYLRLNQCRTAFRAWMLSIAYRETIDRLRRPKLKLVSDDEAVVTVDPSDAAEASERRELLWDVAKQTLSGDQFTALWLFYADDLSAKDIAGVLGQSVVSVKVILHRGRSKLAKALDARSFGMVTPGQTVKAGEP